VDSQLNFLETGFIFYVESSAPNYWRYDPLPYLLKLMSQIDLYFKKSRTKTNSHILVLCFRYLETLRKGDFLKEDQVLNLCNKAKEILIEESNVQRVDTPVTVLSEYET
jgi:hypothetical protein